MAMPGTSPGRLLPLLDPRETHALIPGHHPGLTLFLRHLAPPEDGPRDRPVVLYLHGGTFPSALSIAHRFDGRSWRDALCAAGCHVWALDCHGFGFSDPYPQMAEPAAAHAPLGRAADASRQLEQAVRFVGAHHRVASVAIVAHSWGTIVAGHLAGRCPELVGRLVFFGPIARRAAAGDPVHLPAWRLISLADQWERFTADVPPGEAAVLQRQDFDAWGEAYLDVDPASRTRSPPAVKVPSGAFQDIFDAFGGKLAYDPGLIRCPTAIIRGEWDSLCTDTDAAWLFAALASAPLRRDVKIGRATHLMHLESGRCALYREAETFLLGRDGAPEQRS